MWCWSRRGRPRARDAEGPRPQSALALLRSNPSFTLMLAGVLLSLTAVLPLSNFLVNIVTSRGGTDADLGLAMFVMGAFELPTAFLFPKLLRRFGSGRLLLISAVFGTLKAVALLCTFNYAGVLLAGWTLDMGDANWMLLFTLPKQGEWCMISADFL